MKNAQYSTNDVRRVCENKLRIDFSTKGKEFNGWFWLNGKKVARITVPKGRKPIGKGLYKNMAHQLKLNTQQFDDLLDCPLTLDEYLELLKEAMA
ncbi:MAG TPA: hypothetical protein PKV71_21380 [Calditrichia bacterium]|nr:hypothetical protein [Calditrichota bacterium]HQU73708.1 hypothetical protein [Calditrichia bacterium]HQV34456.1 hypothetical protein [Calditrichia bacterium]